MRRDPHAHALRQGRFSQVGLSYAITKCTRERKPILNLPLGGQVPAAIIVESILELQGRGIWSVYGYVVMPDHVHLAVKLCHGELSVAMKSFSSFTSRKINQICGQEGPFWQDGYYEHTFRGEKALLAYLEYMAFNPVRAGLATTPEEWPFEKILWGV
jgi:REP element-mobilizing transposase RayT